MPCKLEANGMCRHMLGAWVRCHHCGHEIHLECMNMMLEMSNCSPLVRNGGEDLVFVCSLSCYMNKHEEPGVETQEEAEQRPDPDFCPTCETDSCDWITFRDEMAERVASLPADTSNRSKRFHARRHYIRLKHGCLGPGVRVKASPCVEEGLGESWPGERVGFQPAGVTEGAEE